MFQKILVPIDGSEHSTRALKDAIKIAKLTHGAITLMHVYPVGTSIITSSKQYFYQLLKEEGKEKLEKGKELAKTEGVDVETLLVEGDAVEQIVNTAITGKFDLVVIGARGVGKLTGLLLGSVSQGVVNNVPCRVLVTKCT